MKIHPQSPRSRKPAEGGYILLVLILFVALLAIAAAAIAPSIAFQVKRDREEELVHRGVQYSRAVRRYYKKFNRYPTKIEDLESSNNLRFLRKRYKDPMTGNDFKVLHLSEIQAALTGNAIGGLTPSQPGSGLGQPANGFGANNSSGGSNSKFSLGSNSADSAKPEDAENGSANAGTGTPQGQSTFGSNPGNNNGANGPNGANGNTDKLGGQTFGGGPIAGVVSTSKAASIREFNKKNHYNQWLFIYDPQSDRGGLLSTPNQPPLAGATDINGNPGSSPGISGGGSQNPSAAGSPFGGAAQTPPQNAPPQNAPPQNTPPPEQ